ncbi:MAG: ATP-dependent DNA helicase [Methanoregulaceae archaeon PtaB.Bin108]|nr:MAG: ATP-dependent DNA helicase [Methanoregulaceae archaeon PtaB.Bin108]
MHTQMDSLDDWFPYPDFRPHQEEMLDFGLSCARDGAIGLIDAPTGSGKSSVLAALLAAREGKKILVAVRTVSQLNTFIRELSLIREKKPGLKVAYLIGKRGMCLLGGEGDVYRRCEGVKGFSTTLMRQRAEKGSLVPSRDPYIQQQIRRMDPQKPLLCPHFIGSRVFIQSEGSVRMVPSSALQTKADRVTSQTVWPHAIREIASGICPYEMMILAAQKADVILLNYQHVFSEDIRQSLYPNLNLDPGETILLIDEAHNCGDAISAAQSITITRDTLLLAGVELTGLKRSRPGAEALQQVIPRISQFMEGLENSFETEDWFDPAIFDRMVVKGSLYRDMSEILDDLTDISEKFREKNIRTGDFKETALERLTSFIQKISQSYTDSSYLTLYRRDEGILSLEVRSIDPGSSLQEIAKSHHSCLLISGTLSPVESYARYYFGSHPVRTLALPNAFPKKNRLIVCAHDITTAFSMRQNEKNLTLIQSYIEAFSRLPGNLAIYFPSYQILDLFSGNVMRSVKKKKIFIEPRDPRDAEESLRAFLSLPESGESGLLLAVCGGKWSEGLDYRGELLRGAMVIGLPLAPFNQVRKMIIEYFRRRFGEEGEFLCYTLPAINRAQQALGRVLRTPEDRGVLVLGEKRFLEPRVKSGLPAWMREEISACSIHEFGGLVRAWK